MTWDFQEDTDVQDGKWQVNSLKFLQNRLNSFKFLKAP